MDYIPEHFENYSEFSLWLDEHSDEFETESDYISEEGYGWCVHHHIPSDRYFYESIDENDAEFVEVIKTNKLVYDIAHDITDDSDVLATLFDCCCCGETAKDDRIEYAWYDRV